MHTEMLHINNSCAIFVETKSEVLLWLT
jgi:hypothetical protein